MGYPRQSVSLVVGEDSVVLSSSGDLRPVPSLVILVGDLQSAHLRDRKLLELPVLVVFVDNRFIPVYQAFQRAGTYALAPPRMFFYFSPL